MRATRPCFVKEPRGVGALDTDTSVAAKCLAVLGRATRIALLANTIECRSGLGARLGAALYSAGILIACGSLMVRSRALPSVIARWPDALVSGGNMDRVGQSMASVCAR